MDVISKHAPLKGKYIRTNHAEYVVKGLSQTIMKRSKLRNVYLKHRSEENRVAYKKQRNFFTQKEESRLFQYLKGINFRENYFRE